MSSAPTNSGTTETVPEAGRFRHLAALVSAFAVVASACWGGYEWTRSLQERYLHSVVAPEFSDAKLHGVAFLREAFSRPDTLVVFGSSELLPTEPLNGIDFFRDFPTGFGLFPVGKPGTTALSVLQKIGSVGDVVGGKKVVISLSPAFFMYQRAEPKYFEGNFSELQAKEMLHSPHLSHGLKRDAARQMLAYPRTYERDMVLRTLVRRLAKDRPRDRVLLALFEPVVWFDRWVSRLQDHAEVLVMLREREEADEETAEQAGKVLEVPRAPGAKLRRRKLDWGELFRFADRHARAMAVKAAEQAKSLPPPKPTGSADEQWLRVLRSSQEWDDFELVLRALKELGAEALVMSMPLHGDLLERDGVSAGARKEYGERLRELTGRYDTPLVYFSSHEGDPVFFKDKNDHIGSKGWWYYNKVIDDFFHGRLKNSDIAAKADGPPVQPPVLTDSPSESNKPASEDVKER